MPFCDVSMSQSILEQILFFCGFFFFLLGLGLSGNTIHFCDLTNALLKLEKFQQKSPLTLTRLAFTSLLLGFIL